MHFRSNPLLNQKQLNVDRENGVIKNISIVEEGPNKNGTYFGKKYLNDLADGANQIKAGVKSRFGHPNMCSTTLGKYVGRYKNFQFDGKKVTADLHLDDITKKTEVEGQGIKMFDYIMDMAESNADMFGNSIHIPIPDYEDDPVEVENKKYHSHIFNGIVASDIVDSPAATSGLFDTEDLGVVMTQFLDENPEVFNTVQKNPKILEEFFERYANYQENFNSKIDMSFLDKLKKKFGASETFDIEETLADGTVVTIKTENESPQAGDAVTDEEGKPVPDGEHVTKDGSTIVTEGGIISEIREAGDEGDDGNGDEGEPTMGEVMQSVQNLTNSFNQFKTQYGKDLKENQDAIELVHGDLEKKFNNLAKTVKSKDPKDYTASGKGKKTKMSESGYDPDAVREAREARKNKK